MSLLIGKKPANSFTTSTFLTLFHISTNRCDTLTTAWVHIKQKNRSVDKDDKLLAMQLTFAGAIEQATLLISDYLVNDFSSQLSRSSNLSKMMINETRQYFQTGNWGKGSEAASVNPTFLEPKTSRWVLGHTICPFYSYLPLPVKELNEKNVKKGIIADYCRNELKKLLIAFRERMKKIMFYFHPCDALAFCYGDLPYKFDVIDTSNLSDDLGLANLLNAAGRKLLSHQSLLITEARLVQRGPQCDSVRPGNALLLPEPHPDSLRPPFDGPRRVGTRSTS